LDAVDGRATAWDAKPNNTVSAIAVSGNTLYAAGQFDNIGLQYRNHFGAVFLTSGTATPLDLTASGNISSFGVSAG